MHIDYKNQNKQVQNKKEYKMFKNLEIFKGKIRLIEEGQAPQIVERDDAIALAESRGLDLVQIAYNKADFPHSVCKILDYNKFIYQQKQKEKQAKKAAKANEVDIKEICFSIRCDTNDLETKVNKIRKFLEDGDKVKLIVKLLRRELHLTEFAKSTMKTVLGKVSDIAEFDVLPSAAGNMISCTIRHKK